MNLDRNRVQSMDEVSRRDDQRPGDARYSDTARSQGAVHDVRRRHVVAVDFRAVEIKYRAVVHNGTKRQAQVVGVASEVEFRAEIISDDTRAGAVGERQKSILWRGQHDRAFGTVEHRV